jgi:glyoxylase-like metal-dependent hydrolase (beta-lactamase superfamily II)
LIAPWHRIARQARLLALLLAAMASAASHAGAPSPVPDNPLLPLNVGNGVYMFRGAAGEVDPANQGRVGNAGFIVGDAGVIAVDTGTSYLQGLALLQAIERVTDKPVRLALVTHTRQEFLFGAAAFRERGIPVRMQRHAAALMAARCENCLKTLKRVLGDEAMRGTTMFEPDQVFDDSHQLDLIGRAVQVLYFGHSSGPGDIAVFDPASGVLFAGGLLNQERIPDVQDSELPAWTEALAALKRWPIRTIVPGHGPASPPDLIDTNLRYMHQLDTRLRELLRKDAALSEVPDGAALPEFERWDQYDTIHRRNASVWFLRLEREQWAKPQE